MKAKKIVTVLVMLAIAFGWTATTSMAVMKYEITESEGDDLDKKPAYKGGNEALFKFIQETVVYPEESKKKKEEGKVVVSFVVGKTGELSEIEIKKSSGSDLLDQEALRVIHKMPDWVPGEKDGKKVSVEYALPIMFKL